MSGYAILRSGRRKRAEDLRGSKSVGVCGACCLSLYAASERN